LQRRLDRRRRRRQLGEAAAELLEELALALLGPSEEFPLRLLGLLLLVLVLLLLLLLVVVLLLLLVLGLLGGHAVEH
jgi:hypothetical protein